MKHKNMLAMTLLLGLLSACGGGSNGDSNSDNKPQAADDQRRVPASALASASAYSLWAASLARSDSADAVVVEADLKPPQSETEEPIGLR